MWCWQHEINQFAVSSFVPLEQSYFSTPNLAGAMAIVETGIAEDSDERMKEVREMGHMSKKCECCRYLFISVLSDVDRIKLRSSLSG